MVGGLNEGNGLDWGNIHRGKKTERYLDSWVGYLHRSSILGIKDHHPKVSKLL